MVAAVERAETLRVLVAERAEYLVLVRFDEELVGIKTVTGFVERADTVVFNGVLDVIERVALAVVVFVLDFVLDTEFSPRTAHSASGMQNTKAQIKSKNFFISRLILTEI